MSSPNRNPRLLRPVDKKPAIWRKPVPCHYAWTDLDGKEQRVSGFVYDMGGIEIELYPPLALARVTLPQGATKSVMNNRVNRLMAKGFPEATFTNPAGRYTQTLVRAYSRAQIDAARKLYGHHQNRCYRAWQNDLPEPSIEEYCEAVRRVWYVPDVPAEHRAIVLAALKKRDGS